MTSPRVALVTGTNQGLGLALAEGLAARLAPADLVLLSGRDATRVAAAVATVGRDGARVEGRVLDVRDDDSIDALVETNNLGSTRMLRAFTPVLRPGAVRPGAALARLRVGLARTGRS